MKGRKMNYSARWEKETRYVPIVMAGIAGDRLRKLRDEVRREHRISRSELGDYTALPEK